MTPSVDRAWSREPALRVIDCVLSLRRNYDLFVVPRLSQDQFAAFKIVYQFFDGSGDEAGCKLLRRFPERGSDLLDRPAVTISFERADQSLDSALGRRFLADERVP